MKRFIKKVAVLGSGVMGSRIACHFANTGSEVLLLDIVSPDADPNKPNTRNNLVNAALQNAIKSNPAPLYSSSFATRISTGNFEDDMQHLSDCDWIIEVVVERLDIKQKIFSEVEKYRKPGSLITSNTSGIPIALMSQGRSEDFRRNFCGTHFFNPPRYLKLLEIIPGPDSDKDVIAFLLYYGQKFLGKETVLCKDTPAFIANRIGVMGIMQLFHLVPELGLSVEEVDKLTGPVMGRPKSATFRTCDVVGLDTLVHVAKGLAEYCKNDEAHALLTIPDYVAKMVENKWLGSKSGQGFYKKEKGSGGKGDIKFLDLKTLEYQPSQKVKFATLEQAKAFDELEKRIPVLLQGKDKAGNFFRRSFAALFSYVAHRIPEISNDLYRLDDAMRAGFGWEAGPFEYWQMIGVENGAKLVKSHQLPLPSWVDEMIKGGHTTFYKTESDKIHYYDLASKSYLIIPGQENKIQLTILKQNKKVWSNSGTSVIDLGDGIINLEFHSKMNTIGGEVIEGINKAIDLAEQNFAGLTVYNEGANFSAGANVGLIFMFAVEQEWDELNYAIKAFQNAMMRVRYSSVPVVAAPHNMALGGSCELCLHADAVLAHAETYMGLVEFGVGVIPGGGGTKEFTLRLSDELEEGDVELNTFRKRFLTIGQAKVSTSAEEAFGLGYLRKGIDRVIPGREFHLLQAKELCLNLSNAGYVQPVKRKDIKVLGRQALGLAYLGADSMQAGHYISEHDVKISRKLAWVLCGGDLSRPALVSEDYLLDLEREAFLSLCGERKTLERIQSILTGGKILRN